MIESPLELIYYKPNKYEKYKANNGKIEVLENKYNFFYTKQQSNTNIIV